MGLLHCQQHASETSRHEWGRERTLAKLVSQPPLKIAVAGCSGLIGKRHCQHVAPSPSTQLVAIVDPSPGCAETATLHHAVLYSSVQESLSSPHQAEAAVVCTPSYTHVPVSQALLQAGIHILREKRIRTTVGSAKKLLEVAEQP